MILRNVLLVYHPRNYGALSAVEHVLRKHHVRYKAMDRSKAHSLIPGKDLIIVVGGDGTFLRASHCVDNTPVWSVSSHVGKNEGFFSSASPDDFERKLVLYLAGKAKITRLPRIEARINGKLLSLRAVNEVFAGTDKPYKTAQYVLAVGRKKELQKSSGVIVFTQAGSNAWAKSTCGKRMNIPSRSVGFAVREPYIGRLTPSKMLRGIVKSVTLESQMEHTGIVVVDSVPKEFRFVRGDVLTVTVSSHPLKVVRF
jgi:NAD kinase